MGAAGTRHSLRPLYLDGGGLRQKLGHLVPRERDRSSPSAVMPRFKRGIQCVVRRVGKAKRAHRPKRGGHGALRLSPPYALSKTMKAGGYGPRGSCHRAAQSVDPVARTTKCNAF